MNKYVDYELFTKLSILLLILPELPESSHKLHFFLHSPWMCGSEHPIAFTVSSHSESAAVFLHSFYKICKQFGDYYKVK